MKKPKTKPAVIVRQHESLKSERDRIQEEKDRHSLTDQQVDSIIGELIDDIDHQFVESAFRFRMNFNGTAYLETFIDKLNPYARHLEKKLRTALPRVKYRKLPGEPDRDLTPDSDLTQLTMTLEESAYIIGVFMGAKVTGASDVKLNLLRKHLVL